MLKPAMLYREQLLTEFHKIMFSKAMFYFAGRTYNPVPSISSDTVFMEGERYQWAVLNDNSELIGFIEYYVDWVEGYVREFKVISFNDTYRAIVALEMLSLFKRMIHNKRLHRIELRVITDNHVAQLYKKTLEHYCANSYEYELHECAIDACGNFHNMTILEGLW